jgi:membrane protein YdbS with pleckstrin-like domain
VAISTMRVGLALLAVAIESGVVLVTRFVFDGWASVAAGTLVGVAVIVTWLVLPAVLRASRGDEHADEPSDPRAGAGGGRLSSRSGG